MIIYMYIQSALYSFSRLFNSHCCQMLDKFILVDHVLCSQSLHIRYKQRILKQTLSWRMDFDWNTSSHSLKSLWTLLIYYSLYCWLSVIAWSCQCSLNSQYMPTTLIQCIPSLFFTTMFVTNTLLLVGCTSRVRSGCNGDLTIN